MHVSSIFCFCQDKVIVIYTLCSLVYSLYHDEMVVCRQLANSTGLSEYLVYLLPSLVVVSLAFRSLTALSYGYYGLMSECTWPVIEI